MTVEKNVCHECYGYINGECVWGGDVNNPPRRWAQCQFRKQRAEALIVEAAIARATACPWPKPAEAV